MQLKLFQTSFFLYSPTLLTVCVGWGWIFLKISFIKVYLKFSASSGKN